VTKFFPFIFSALVDKLQCADLEGVSDLPEDMMPTPSQKPHKISNVTENSEEIRVLYIKLLESLIFRKDEIEISDPEERNAKLNQNFRLFVQDIVNITRTLCMDPCNLVVLEACNFLKQLTLKFGKDLLFYFNSILSRALYYALTHKQSKIRIAALDCLDKLMYCSPYKKNAEIMEQLIGFRDPNLVPIRDFYESSTKLNYLALLVADPSIQVVKRFYEIITGWMIYLEDKADHESRLIPYILSGLFDPNEEICLFVCERLELMGKQYEIDYEKDIRETKQFGIDSKWMDYSKKSQDDPYNLYYPFPLASRPTLGSRLLVKKYLRRYIKNLCKEFNSIEETIRARISNLLLFSVIYSEDAVIEFLDQILFSLARELVKNKPNKQNMPILEPIYKTLKILGRFCDFDSIANLIFPTLLGDLNANYAEIQRGSLMCFRYLVEGHLESICNDDYGFGIYNGKLKETLNVLTNPKFLDQLDSAMGIELLEFYYSLMNITNNRKVLFKKSLNEFVECLNLIFDNIIHSLGALSIFDLHGVSNNQLLSDIEKKLDLINKNIIDILSSKYLNEVVPRFSSFFTFKARETLEDINKYLEKNSITLNNKNYQIFYIFIKQNSIFMKEDEEENKRAFIELILSIFTNIFKSSFNLPIHIDTLKLLSAYFNNNSIDFSNNPTLIPKILPSLIPLFFNIILPYSDVEIDKFKYADLLKDEKELEKKRLKAPQTIKSEMREKILLILKNFINKNELFTLNKENLNNTEKLENSRSVVKEFLKIIDKEFLNEFAHENERNRKLFADFYSQFLVKILVIFRTDSENERILKGLIENFETYFMEEIYDSVIDVRLSCVSIFNLLLTNLQKSSYFEPMCKLFNDSNEPNEKNDFEFLQALAYLDDDNKQVDSFFKNFKNIFSIVLNLYIDEKGSFGNLCENSFRLIIEKFPIYTFNELLRAKNKNQLSRIELLNKMLSKYLKSK